MHVTLDNVCLHLNHDDHNVKDVLLKIIGIRDDIVWHKNGFFVMSTEAYMWLYTVYHSYLDGKAEDTHMQEIQSVDKTDDSRSDSRTIEMTHADELPLAAVNTVDEACQTPCKILTTASTQTDAYTIECSDRKSYRSAMEDDTRSVASTQIRPMDMPTFLNGRRQTYTVSEVSAPSAVSGFDWSTQPHKWQNF